MIRCEICQCLFKTITHTHLKQHDMTIEEYLNKFPGSKLSSEEMFDVLSKAQKGKKIGDNNPSKRKDVREKIANSVRQKWDNGDYDDRINGMLGAIKELHPGYKPEIHTPLFLAEKNYVALLSQYQDVTRCVRCGSVTNKINIHHVDENHENFLISNLEPLCVPCHTSFHYKKQKQPFLYIGKTMSFAAAHNLPNYKGKCNNLHGHEWSIEIVIRKRIDPKTGMVIDFSKLKQSMDQFIISILDHNYINNIIPNPTAENILVWCWSELMFKAYLKGIEKIKLWESPDSCAILDKVGMLSIFSEKIESYI